MTGICSPCFMLEYWRRRVVEQQELGKNNQTNKKTFARGTWMPDNLEWGLAPNFAWLCLSLDHTWNAFVKNFSQQFVTQTKQFNSVTYLSARSQIPIRLQLMPENVLSIEGIAWCVKYSLRSQFYVSILDKCTKKKHSTVHSYTAKQGTVRVKCLSEENKGQDQACISQTSRRHFRPEKVNVLFAERLPTKI